MIYLSIVLALIFFLLSILHFYWAAGGKWAFINALPVKDNGELLLKPRAVDSLIVGIGLSILGLFYLVYSNIIYIDMSRTIFLIIGWIIPCIFLLRAIGDFKYVGFTKKWTSSKFASLDTKIYSPLCLIISILAILIQIID